MNDFRPIHRKPRLQCLCHSQTPSITYIPPTTPIILSQHLQRLLCSLRKTTAITIAAFTLTLLPSHARPFSRSKISNITIQSTTQTHILHHNSHRTKFSYPATTPIIVFDKDYLSNSHPLWDAAISDHHVAPSRLALGGLRNSPSTLASEVRILTRLLVALVVGGVIGMERRAANSLAGVRTFSLVSLGAAIFMSTALVAFPDSDPARIAAAISSSVGFLGAGAMHKNAKHNKGLTTASSIWLAAALGIAAASGMFLLSFTGAISTVLIARYARFDSSLHLVRGDSLDDFDADDDDDEDEVQISRKERIIDMKSKRRLSVDDMTHVINEEGEIRDRSSHMIYEEFDMEDDVLRDDSEIENPINRQQQIDTSASEYNDEDLHTGDIEDDGSSGNDTGKSNGIER